MHLVPDGCFPMVITEPRLRATPFPRVWISGGRVNVRNGPGHEHSGMDVVKRGTRVAMLGRGTDARGKAWLKIGLRDGRVGWIAAWFARDQRPRT